MIDSEYGVGSIFSFELVQQIADATELGPFSSVSEEDNETPLPVTPRFTAPEAKILVVDDNQMNRFVFQGLLKYLKVQVTFAESGKECLSTIATQHFDLIFMDHLMPELDGIETLHIMKKRSGHLCTDSKVIAVTANAYPDARDFYLKEGFDDFLEKPVEGKQLEAIIYQYLPQNLIWFADNYSEGNTSLSDKAAIPSIPVASDTLLKEQLSRMGIDVAKGLSYASDDWSFYLEVLKCFIKEYADKRDLLLTRKKNLSEYSHFETFTNLTHQLKGESRGIGHMELGEKFYQLEMASRAHQKDTIAALFQDTLDLWERVVTSLKTCLP